MTRRFLMEGDSLNKQAVIQQISNPNILGLHKINLFSIACALGKKDAVAEASKMFDMWMGLDDTTLIQTCAKTNDSD